MANATWILIFAIFLIVFNDAILSTLGDYHSEYEDWKVQYKRHDTRASSYIQKANNKSMSRLFQHYTQTEKDAVEVVHLYTQGQAGIYRTVNSQYRQDNVEPIWRDYAALLNEALDILVKHSGDCNKYEELYRGSQVLPDGIPGTALFKGFTSTTESPKETLIFGIRESCENEGCQVLMILNEAQGLSVKKFSEFSYEDEVIIKLNARFDFPSRSVYYSSKPSDRPVIEKELQRLQIHTPVKILARGSQIHNKRQNCISDGNSFAPSYITFISFFIVSTSTSI